MSIFQLALLIGAIVAAAISWRLPRAWLWIAAGAASFVISTAYARYGLPWPAWVTGLCDATICLAVYFFGHQKWEMRIFNLFQLSVLLSIGYLAGVIRDHTAYVIGLEAVNWLALLTITMTVVTSGWGHGNAARRSPWSGFRWAQRSLHAQRAEPPFTRQAR